MAAAVKNGQKVACISATRGEEGSQDAQKWPPHRLAEIRTAELEECLRIIGVSNHSWLDYPDGKCDEVDFDEAVSRVTEIAKRVKPDTILTFEPMGITGHEDHKAVSKWCKAAIERLPGSSAGLYYAYDSDEFYNRFGKEADEKFNVYFNIDRPITPQIADFDIVYRPAGEILELKYQAMLAQPSQMEAIMASMGEQQFREIIGLETFKRA